ncbi:hypothetical protein [Hymenobacter yonginensis]|uniref:Uncharacterized protein n=1 Tax=Hymenobacter yonginensis TaxID=748197 RepID=A0ABY7PTJ4_9BACT|nr:hypothetical protein [Hymenobacter yonginensis]WBO86258.1 hypothetical protein O9Z63_08345 [Hymenobacter yonginensis]
MAKETNKSETRQPTIESLTTENTRLQGELDAANIVIAGQAAALKKAETAAAASDAIVVTHEDKQYRVLGKQFRIKGELVKAEELEKNPEALKLLVDSKSGLLVLITKEEAAAE